MHKPLRTLVNLAVSSMIASSVAHASGFSLYGESTGYTIGNYAAGAAAEAVDASTGWYNPAGLSLLHEQQFVFGGVGVFPTLKINGDSTFTTKIPTVPTLEYAEQFNGLEGGVNAFVPSFHYARPLRENTTFGFSMTAPFGLSTDWAPNSPVRYSATHTEVLTVNISPELGTRLTEHFALGAGVDVQWAQVKFNQIVGAPALLANVFDKPPNALDSLSYNKGSSYGVGFHMGIMGLFNQNHTRLGINYQSKVRHVFHGRSTLSGPFANNFDIFGVLPSTSGVWQNGNLSSNPQEFPDLLAMSIYQDVNQRLALLGSVVYTGWSVFKTVQLNNIAAPEIDPATFEVFQGSISNSVPQNFKDTWRIVVGANYYINPQFMLRVGGGYDQDPTNLKDRNIRLPDSNRWALAIGGHYQWRQNIGLDVGYTHLFSGNNPTIHSNQILSPTSSYQVDSNSGIFNVDLVGAQLTWAIDKAPKTPMK